MRKQVQSPTSSHTQQTKACLAGKVKKSVAHRMVEAARQTLKQVSTTSELHVLSWLMHAEFHM